MKRLLILALSLSVLAACDPKKPAPTEPAKPPAKKTDAKKAAPKADAKKAAPKADAKKGVFTITEVTPRWTAYKFTEKAPVGGTFKKITVSEIKPAATLAETLKGVSVTIDPATIDSGNPERDKTLTASFIKKFASFQEIKASVKEVKEADKKIVIDVTLNGVSKPVEFVYTLDKGALEAKATIDMMDFKLNDAHASIHKACEKLHTGKDGVSKTWTEVALSIKAKVAQ